MAQFLSQNELMNIIGSWNKEGFHGHNRAKSRIEFSNNFRLSAKPSPPEKFKIRFRDNAVKHPFSKHDNKQAFLNDPDLFSQGIGKKKVDTLNKSVWNPNFIAWKNIEGRGTDKPKKTLYQRDFSSFSSPSKLLQNRDSFDSPLISAYTGSFSHGQPTKERSREIQNDLSTRFSFNRAKTCIPAQRSSVADCMVWNVGTAQIQQSKPALETV